MLSKAGWGGSCPILVLLILETTGTSDCLSPSCVSVYEVRHLCSLGNVRGVVSGVLAHSSAKLRCSLGPSGWEDENGARVWVQ